MKHIKISTEYITLGQFLKLADVIDTGGAVKMVFTRIWSVREQRTWK